MKIAKKAHAASKHAHCATASRKQGPSVDAATFTAFHFGKPFITSPRYAYGGPQKHVIGKMVPLAKFRRQERDNLSSCGGQRLRLKDEESSEITLHSLKWDRGSGLTGPGSKTMVRETWLADSNPSDTSRKVSNPPATAGKFTHQKWNPAYLADK
jgi:hypothetical protein